jgi:hypothetical protein
MVTGAREPRLGVDVGRVIIAGSGNADTSFLEGSEQAMLATPEVDGAIDTIARLQDVFAGRIWLVSKCGRRVQQRTLRWLAAHDFWVRTGLPETQVRFCRTRAEKREHCLSLQLTHFVDDHREVHAAIRGTVQHQYFFGSADAPVPAGAEPAPTWADAERLIRASLGTPAPGLPSSTDG